MKFDEIYRHLKGIPYIPVEKARILYDFVIEAKPAECLELGFAHGASTCYMAAALDEIGSGHVTAVDLHSGRDWQVPSIEDLLEKTKLAKYVTVERENVSYTWFVKRKIEEQTKDYRCDPCYDFCYIDGPKNWTVDGAAFFMVDKLLRDNGYILFDDMTWTYASADEWSARKLEESGILVSQMGEDERLKPQVESVFRLLVMQHPNYSNFKIQNNDWGWAQKVRSAEAKLTVTEDIDIGAQIKKLARRALRRS